MKLMRKSVVFLLGVLFFTSCLSSGGKQIKGTILIIGNEPHTECVLVTKDNRQYKVSGPLAAKIRKEKQNQSVEVLCDVASEPEGLAPGVIVVKKINNE